MRPKCWILSFSLMFALFACREEAEEAIVLPDVSHIDISVEIERLEDRFFGLKTADEKRQFLREYPDLAKGYFQLRNYPDTSTLFGYIDDFLNLSYNDTLLAESKASFPDMSPYAHSLAQAFRYIKYHYPDWEPPKIYTMVSGFGNFGWGGDIVFGEGFIVLGIDYWAGDSLSYRPPDVPSYILKRYQPNYMVPSVVKLLSTDFNAYDGKDKTLLADMVFYGKSLQFSRMVLPNAHDSLLIGYSGQQLADVHYNLPRIWGYFVENDLFYETLSRAKERYVGERPTTVEISTDCPGRIGRWLGWEIVDQYMRKQQVALPDLMENDQAQQIFQQSGYRPKLQ